MVLSGSRWWMHAEWHTLDSHPLRLAGQRSVRAAVEARVRAVGTKDCAAPRSDGPAVPHFPVAS